MIWNRSIPLGRVKALVAAAATALLALFVVENLSRSTPSHSRAGGELPMAAGPVSVAATPVAKIKTTPAPLMDRNAELFLSTGDGGSGSSVQP